MKKVTNNAQTKRTKLISVISLLLCTVIALMAISYAWFENYVEAQGPGVKTGKMRYEFSGFHYEPDGSLISDFFYSTEQEGVEGVSAFDPTSINVASDCSYFSSVDANTIGQSFFVVSKLQDSIDIDVTLGFEFDGLSAVAEDGTMASVLDYTNSIWYKIYDESDNLIAYMNTDGNTVSSFIEANSTREGMDTYVEGETKILSELNGFNKFEKLVGEDDHMMLRVVYGWNSQTLAASQNVEVPIRVSLDVIQNGERGEEGSGTVNISDSESLRTALASYRAGQTLRIGDNIDIVYTGDITISRPVTLLIQGSLTIQGNLSYIYGDSGDFTVNTQAGGQLIVKAFNDVGGNFVIDTPEANFRMIGANSDVAGEADVYVQGDFRIRTAVVEDGTGSANVGMVFDATRVCALQVDDSGAASLESSTSLKPISISGASRIRVALRTYVGEISAMNNCGRISILNEGNIEKLYLREMYRDQHYTSAATIYIDSRGTWTDELIRLPLWSEKFDQIEGVYVGNTTIISNVGSGKFKAKTPNYYHETENIRNELFFSDYEKPGLLDDVEYHSREFFIDSVDGTNKNILIHYDVPPLEKIVDGTFPEGFGNTLESIINYYTTNPIQGCDDPIVLSQVHSLEIICYGEKALTEADYTSIRQFSTLSELNLAYSISVGKILPRGAFKNMDSLTNLTFSEADTVWMPEILSGTNVTEIWLPASLVELRNDTETINKVVYGKYNVIGGIRIVHTSTTVITGFDETRTTYSHRNYSDRVFYDNADSTNIYKVRQYFFTPDDATRDAYRAKYTRTTGGSNFIWWRCVFTEGEDAGFYGDYVLRLDKTNKTCVFVTNVKNAAFDPATEAAGEYQFNFDTITIDGVVYKITSFEDYSLCMRISTARDIVFGDSVSYIGVYAFGTTVNPGDSNSKFYPTYKTKIATVTLLGDTYIADRAFNSIAGLTEVNAEFVTSIGAYAFCECANLVEADFRRLKSVAGHGTFQACGSLKKIDINVVEKTDTNTTNFATGSTKVVIEIHTDSEYGTPAPDAFAKALSSQVGRTFVQDSYAHLYSDYTAVLCEMGNHTMDTILRADANGNILPITAPISDVAYFFYPEINESGAETGKVVLSACMLASIDGGGSDLTLIGTFTDAESGKSYTLTRFGRAAYRATAFNNVDTLKIPDGVTEIGIGALYANEHAKNCVTLDLNNVTYAEEDAIRYVGCVRLLAPELTRVGLGTITNMSRLIVANLPKLDQQDGAVVKLADKNDSIFSNCGNLLVAFVGPSRSVRYLQHQNNSDLSVLTSAGAAKLTLFFINGEGVEAQTLTPFSHMNVIVANNDYGTTYYKMGSTGTQVNAGKNFSNIVLSNWHTMSGKIGDVEYSVTLPGYVYAIASAENKTLSLRMVSDALPNIHANEDYANFYMTPDALYEDGTVMGYDAYMNPIEMVRYTAREKIGGDFAYRVTAISTRAYQEVTVNTKYFKIGTSTTSISTYVWAYNATVSSVQTLDLSNVISIGDQAMNAFPTTTTQIIANKLQSVGQYGLQNFKGVKKLYLPEIRYIGNYAFANMTALEEMTLGKDFGTVSHSSGKGFAANPMIGMGANQVVKIIILNTTDVVAPPGYNSNNPATLGKTQANANNVFVVIPACMESQYAAKYATSGWGASSVKYKTPYSNFSTFEESYSDPATGLTFFWDKVGDTSAKITFVLGEIPSHIAFPSAVIDSQGNSYTVVSIDVTAVETLPATVTSITLPDGMLYLDFRPADLPSSIASLSIASTNTKFATLDGVLYSKDMTTLFIYPRMNTPENSVFNLPETVNYIADEAFYAVTGIKTINITNAVRIGYRAFADTDNLVEIIFASETPSVLFGRDVFYGADPTLKLYVPDSAVENYKESVWFDYEIKDKIVGVSTLTPPEEEPEA